MSVPFGAAWGLSSSPMRLGCTHYGLFRTRLVQVFWGVVLFGFDAVYIRCIWVEAFTGVFKKDLARWALYDNSISLKFSEY